MKEKKLIIQFSKGSKYEILASKIAENRAEYYTIADGYEINSEHFLCEVKHALEDEFEIFDWVQNNMNWDDLVKLGVKRIESEEFDPDKEWNDGNHTISVNY